MRLSTEQIQAIRQAATAAFGAGTSVWLFGSRVDDAKKGGDIDLLVCPQMQATSDAVVGQQSFMKKIKMMPLEIKKLVHAGIRAQVSSATTKGPNH